MTVAPGTRTGAARAAERWLVGRELFGIRPGLQRMRALLGALGDPQDAVPTIHVVGSDGKTSTATIAAALLRGRGLRAGAVVSPHLRSFRERVLLDGAPVAEGPFADAVDRVRLLAEVAGDEHGPVTQFEAISAAAFLLLAEAGLDAAVVEAGLGGRLDATNVLPPPGPGRPAVAVLTGISLEHTRWLGPDPASIAGEKVAVLRPGGTLVLAADLPEAADDVARRRADDVGARIVGAPADPGADVPTPGAPPFQRRNLALAMAAVDAHLGPRTRDGHAREGCRAVARAVGADLVVPGRFELVGRRPAIIRDGAHDPAGARALAEALRARRPARPVVAVLAVRADKDLAAMLAALTPALDEVVATTLADGSGPTAVASAAAARGWMPADRVRHEPDAAAALAAATRRAGPAGTVVVCGSLHLLAELARAADPDPPVAAGF